MAHHRPQRKLAIRAVRQWQCSSAARFPVVRVEKHGRVPHITVDLPAAWPIGVLWPHVLCEGRRHTRRATVCATVFKVRHMITKGNAKKKKVNGSGMASAITASLMTTAAFEDKTALSFFFPPLSLFPNEEKPLKVGTTVLGPFCCCYCCCCCGCT